MSTQVYLNQRQIYLKCQITYREYEKKINTRQRYSRYSKCNYKESEINPIKFRIKIIESINQFLNIINVYQEYNLMSATQKVKLFQKSTIGFKKI